MEEAKKEKESFDEEATAYVRLGSQYSIYVYMGLSNRILNMWVWSPQLQAQEEGEGNSKEAEGDGSGWKRKPSLSSSYIHIPYMSQQLGSEVERQGKARQTSQLHVVQLAQSIFLWQCIRAE